MFRCTNPYTVNVKLRPVLPHLLTYDRNFMIHGAYINAVEKAFKI